MIDPHRLVLFLAAALVLAITPGPGIFYVLARTLAGGRREGIHSSLGTFLGGLFHVFAAALGVSAILATSVILNTTADLLVVLLAAPLERKLKSSPRFRSRQRIASGVGMIGLGVYVALKPS